jgi:hypothetical protein
MSDPRAFADTIRDTLQLLHGPRDVFEIRALGARGALAVGYFDEPELAARTAEKLDRHPDMRGVYVTLNPLDQACLARAVNRIDRNVKASADADVAHRRRLLIDLDPVRPAEVSSTAEELRAAKERAALVRDTLAARGWPMPAEAESGNGAHVLYAAALSNDGAATNLVKQCLAALDLQFSDDAVAIDRSVYNAGRIVRLYGTTARKGDDVPDRPHRRSALVHVPRNIIPVSREQLEALAATLPAEQHYAGPRSLSYDLRAFLQRNAISVAREGLWNGASKFILTECPFDSTHTGTSAALIQFSNGPIAFKCFHNACASREWRDVRELFEPSAVNAPARSVGRYASAANGAARVEATAIGDAPEKEFDARLRIVNAEDVPLVPIEWLMRNRVPRFELTLFDGDGGIGKSTVASAIIAALTTRAPLPDGTCRGPMTCLIVAEEDRRETLVARLRVAGADLSRVKFAPVVEWTGGEGSFRMPDHVPLLERAAVEVGAEFIYIDALFDHFGSATDGRRLNPSYPADVREALRPLTRFAHESAKTIVATRHWGKSTTSAKHRGYGAADLTNVARAVLSFAKHPTSEGRYVVATAKQNLGKQTDALVYSIDSAQVIDDEGRPIYDEDGVQWEVGRIVWHDAESVSADDVAMATPLNPEERSALQEAREAIVDALAACELHAGELESRVVEEGGIAPVTFRRARRDLRSEGSIARSGGGAGGSVRWRLVPLNLIDPIESRAETMRRNARDEILLPVEPKSNDAVERVETPAASADDLFNYAATVRFSDGAPFLSEGAT